MPHTQVCVWGGSGGGGGGERCGGVALHVLGVRGAGCLCVGGVWERVGEDLGAARLAQGRRLGGGLVGRCMHYPHAGVCAWWSTGGLVWF